MQLECLKKVERTNPRILMCGKDYSHLRGAGGGRPLGPFAEPVARAPAAPDDVLLWLGAGRVWRCCWCGCSCCWDVWFWYWFWFWFWFWFVILSWPTPAATAPTSPPTPFTTRPPSSVSIRRGELVLFALLGGFAKVDADAPAARAPRDAAFALPATLEPLEGGRALELA